MLVLIGLTLCPLWAWGQGQIRLESGTQLILTGTVEIVVNNLDWQQDGTLVPGNSVITLRNNANNIPVEILGNETPDFYDLVVDGDGTDVILGTDLAIAHEWEFIQGNVDLNGQEIDLLGTGTLINEADSRRVFDNAGGGIITTTVLLNAPSQAQPGNLGAVLSSSANLGSTVLRRGHQVQPLAVANGISRYYDITPTNNSGLNATLRFGYLQSELNGVNEGNMLLHSSTDGGVSYTNQGVSQVNPANDWLELIGIDAFGRWTAGEGTPFPVEWLGISARWLRDEPLSPAVISWETAEEIGTDHYRVERKAASSGNWMLAGEVAAEALGSYSLIDKQATILREEPRWFYRIVEVDVDGRESLSDVVVLSRAKVADWVSISPNPSQGTVRLQTTLADRHEARKLVLQNLQGQLLWETTLPAVSALDQTFTLPDISPGIYLIELITTHQQHRIRLQINP
ncbi:MAG: T9SS type A sorting domain-containing protein [Bacteroidota bacterium]